MHARFIGRKGVLLASSLAVFAAMAAAGITPASAASASAPTYYSGDNCGISQDSYSDGNYCPGGLMLYYHANGIGATASIQGDIDDLSLSASYLNGSLNYYTNYVFWATAEANNDGAGQAIRNNVASVSNTSSGGSYTLYVYPDYSGDSQTFGPEDYYANLDSNLVNNEASMIES